MTVAAAKDGELRYFDAEGAFLETSVLVRRYTFKIPEEYEEFPEAWVC